MASCKNGLKSFIFLIKILKLKTIICCKTIDCMNKFFFNCVVRILTQDITCSAFIIHKMLICIHSIGNKIYEYVLVYTISYTHTCIHTIIIHINIYVFFFCFCFLHVPSNFKKRKEN